MCVCWGIGYGVCVCVGVEVCSVQMYINEVLYAKCSLV